MEIKLIGSTNNLKEIEDMKRFSYDCGRTCYTKENFEDVQKEPLNKNLLKNMIKSGHHSIFEHIWLTFEMKNIPKMFVMLLNNEKQYSTSEKSARYTEMENMVPEQKEKYDKWMEILIPEIDEVYPQMDNVKKRKRAVRNLTRENARYMTSVFTPTKMIHTLNLRQINFLINEFKIFYEKYKKSNEVIKQRLTESTKEFLEQTEKFKIEGLENQTDRHLSLFNPKTVEKYFGDTYSTNYLMSFAGLAQAQRHRTINYHISGGAELNAQFGFFVPEIVSKRGLSEIWLRDLKEIAKSDFPQAQLVRVNEAGTAKDFRSKAMLRMCGDVQHETMRNTLGTAKEYEQFQKEYGEEALKPKCLQGFKCNEPCAWGGKKALERIV